MRRLVLGVSGASIPYRRTRSLVCSGVVTWIVSLSETLVTLPLTARIGSRAKEREAREKVVNTVSRQRMRKALMEDIFRGMALPL